MNIKKFKSFFGDILYHGSKNKYDELIPFPSKIIKNDKAIYATNKKWLSLCFIAKFSDSDIEIGYVNDVPYIEELKKNAFDCLKVKGFIHAVSPDGFKEDKRLGLKDMEFIKKQKTKVLYVEEVDNVYLALKDTEVYMIPYDIAVMIQNQKKLIT